VPVSTESRLHEINKPYLDNSDHQSNEQQQHSPTLKDPPEWNTHPGLISTEPFSEVKEPFLGNADGQVKSAG
jgi:hypothetical protein